MVHLDDHIDAFAGAEEDGIERLRRGHRVAVESDHFHPVAGKRDTAALDCTRVQEMNQHVNYGGSTRAAHFVVLAAKARALSRKRYHVTYDDITSMVVPVLRHRILLNFHADSDRVDADEILNRLIAHVPRQKEV
jgi:MoxR-like ATPase